MPFLYTFRLAALATVILFSIIVLGVSADLIHTTESLANVYFAFDALALAVALLTLFTVVPMFVIDFMRAGAVTSFVLVELVVLSVLSVLWLAAGAQTASQTFGISINCGDLFFDVDVKVCHETNTIEAFSFLNWLILMAYAITLLVFGIRAKDQWMAPTRNLEGAPTNTYGTQQHQMGQVPAV